MMGVVMSNTARLCGIGWKEEMLYRGALCERQPHLGLMETAREKVPPECGHQQRDSTSNPEVHGP